MKKIVILILSIVVASFLFNPAMAQQKVFNFNHTFGPNTSHDLSIKWFATQIEQRTKGALKMKVFSAGELGDGVEQLESLKLGALESAYMGGESTAAVCPEYGALELPYLWRDQEHYRKVWAGPIGQEITQLFLERKGIRILAALNRGPRNLTTKNKAVKVPDDLKGLKIRTIQNPVHIEAWKALGAIPVPMAFVEVFTALQQGTIDGQENPYEMIYHNSFYEVQKYLVLTRHVRSLVWLGVSEKFWKTLSAEQQKIFIETVNEADAYNEKLLEASQQDLEQKLQAKGMIFVKPDLEKFTERVKTVPEKFKNVWKPGLFEKVLATR